MASIQCKVIKDNILNHDRAGHWQKCRALLDSGFQSNFITEILARIPKMNQVEKDVSIICERGVDTFTKNRITMDIRLCDSKFLTKLSFLILNSMTSYQLIHLKGS